MKDPSKLIQYFHLVDDAAQDAISIFTIDGKYAACNQATVRMHGLEKKEDIIGRHGSDFIAPESFSDVLACFAYILEGKDERADLAFVALGPEQRRIAVEGVMLLLRDQNRIPIGYLVSTHPTDDPTRAATCFRMSEEKYKTFVENAFDGLCILVDEKFEYMNPRFLKMMGYSFDTSLNLRLEDIAKGAELQRARETVNRIVMNQLPVMPHEYTLVRKNGEPIEVEIISTPTEYNGKPGVQAAIRDIKDRKRRLEEDLHRIELEKEVERLREVNQLRTEFLSMVSHELRTPISVVLGILEMTTSGQFGELPQKAHERLGIAYRRGRQLANLINDLLDLAAIESGRLHVHPELVTITEQIRTITDNFSSRASQKNIDLSFHNRSSHRTFVTDRDRFTQILSNLLDNALKFTPAGGRVAVSVEDTDLHHLRFSVADTGIGIPEHMRERVFERFVQVDEKGKRQSGGTGLGLAIVRELVHLLGGSASVQETEGGGTTISFALPRFVRPAARAKEEAPYHLPPRFDRPYVLMVIDDDQDFAALIEDAYGKTSCVVLSALSGTAGLEMLHEEAIDLLLLDLQIPDIDGLEICRRLRADPSKAEMPILVVSAYGQREKIELALAAGADDFLPKPFDMWQLHDRIVKLLGITPEKETQE